MVISWINFDTSQTNTDFSGLLTWIKQAQPRAFYYPDGFTNEVTAIGSVYTRPLRAMRVLNFTTGNGIVDFIGAGLTPDFSNNIFLTVDNIVVNAGINDMLLDISTGNGFFSGRVRPTGSTEILSFRGALFQKQNLGRGFFLRRPDTGQVLIRPN